MSGLPASTTPPARADRFPGRPATPALAIALALGTCVTVNLVDPNVDGALGWCPFKLATGGLDCPGCGMLRATRSLTRGDVLTAMDHNLLWTLLAPLVAWGLLGWWRHERGRTVRRPAPPAWLVGGVAVVAPLFWIVRNLPMTEWLHSGVG